MLDPHYTGFFDSFNQGKYFEAHEVLEHIWLKGKHGPDGALHKGLIQLAGAFVHLQKKRQQPAASLFNLALANLQKYPQIHEQLDVAAVLELIENRLKQLEAHGFNPNAPFVGEAPKIRLIPPAG